MTDRDLTPEDARAEVEAFMGEGYEVDFIVPLCAETDVYADASRLGIRVHGSGPTYRAAVDALKTAWRDAVRPWVDEAMDAGALLDRDEANHKSSIERRDAAYAEELARLLKEDSK